MIKNDAKIIKIDNMSSTVPIKPEEKRREKKRREKKRGEEKRRGEEETKGKEKRGEEGSRSHASIPAVCVDAVGGSAPTENSTPTAPTNGWHGCGTRRWGLEPTAEGGILVIGR